MITSENSPNAFDLLVRNPRMLDVPEAATLLGIGRTLAYELVRTDQWPTPVVRIGRLVRIPSGPVLERHGLSISLCLLANGV
jgi:predicted DNA-binding transcriptional regulator AlpA